MGQSERRVAQDYLQYGMHVVDAFEQVIGTVLLIRKDHFVFRQDVGINQTVSLPMVSISGVIGSLVFLTLTPGEINMVGRVIARRDHSGPEKVRTRIAARPVLEPAGF